MILIKIYTFQVILLFFVIIFAAKWLTKTDFWFFVSPLGIFYLLFYRIWN